MDVQIVASPAAVAGFTAVRIAARLRAAVAARQRASIGFSGGNTPRPMISVLAGLDVPWARVDVFQVDERVAPDGDPARNASVLDALPVDPERIHLMDVTAADLEAACRRYARRLPGRFDVIHLGLGDDGHTASWPPGDSVIDRTEAVAVSGVFNGRMRMTLTPPAVNAARWRVVQVVGPSKADALRRWLDGDDALPISAVRRTGTLIVADPAAAGHPAA